MTKELKVSANNNFLSLIDSDNNWEGVIPMVSGDGAGRSSSAGFPAFVPADGGSMNRCNVVETDPPANGLAIPAIYKDAMGVACSGSTLNVSFSGLNMYASGGGLPYYVNNCLNFSQVSGGWGIPVFGSSASTPVRMVENGSTAGAFLFMEGISGSEGLRTIQTWPNDMAIMYTMSGQPNVAFLGSQDALICKKSGQLTALASSGGMNGGFPVYGQNLGGWTMLETIYNGLPYVASGTPMMANLQGVCLPYFNQWAMSTLDITALGIVTSNGSGMALLTGNGPALLTITGGNGYPVYQQVTGEGYLYITNGVISVKSGLQS